jgi:hypothetical protein
MAHCAIAGHKSVTGGHAPRFGAVEQLCQRTVRKPLTSDSAMTCTGGEPLHRPGRSSAAQRSWEHPAAPPAGAYGARIAADE